MKLVVKLAASLAIFLPLAAVAQDESASSAVSLERPNILVIIADDLGYTDIGRYGSEIRTPNLDALARSGLSFTSFYAAPTCSPSRAMLLSGLDNHLAGFGTMTEHLAVNQRGQPGFEGYLNDRVVTLPTLLRDAGYHTYLAGKWHIGAGAGMRPEARGFERSFAMMQGGGSHFADMKKMLSVYPEMLYYEDGRKVESLPEEFYSSAFYADKIMEYIESNRDDSAPFYAQLAFTAVHWPLQVPANELDRYAGVYDSGYDELRGRRFEQAKAAGLVPAGVPESPRLPRVIPWDELTDEERAGSARAMEIYAAMVENMDRHIGRVVEYLGATGLLDNTVIVFFSDNGAEGSNRLELLDNATWVPANFDLSYENMGRENSYVFVGPGWAQASTTPLRLFKAYVTEGGIRVPAIVSYPGIDGAGSYVRTPVLIQDLMPTFLELAGTRHPGSRYRGREVYSVRGRSLLPLLRGEIDALYEPEHVFGWELFGHRAVRQGDWKALWADGKNGSDTWQLFNLAEDPREVVDLAAREPEKLQHMIGLWEEYARDNNVILPIGDIGNPN
jgi:arylsulfatase A-like enzyme